MKIFISADIEGVSTTSEWSECTSGNHLYNVNALQMTKEVLACCEGAIEAGATEIVVKDAHAGANNIDITMLPDCVKVNRKWSGHPYSMVDTLDKSFDALMFIGYHSAASQGFNPLSHTMSSKNIFYIKINDEIASEFTINSYTGALENVPSVFLTGDLGLCEYSASMNPRHPNLTTVATKEGKGASTTNYSPNWVLSQIKEKSKQALQVDLKKSVLELPKKFKVEICYKEHTQAFKMSFFPNVKLINDNTLLFESNDYFEVLRVLKFVL